MNQSSLERFVKFAKDRELDIGFTHADAAHDFVSGIAIESLNNICPLAGKIVLDVGCGNGRDLKRFKELGANPHGLTLYVSTSLAELQFPITVEDQSFSTLPDGFCDVLFARHVLEHSIVPFFTISEYHRLLRPDGYAYIEVPASGQKAQQELNANHYAVLPELMWYNFFVRAGFDIVSRLNAPVDLYDKDGTLVKDADLWWGYFLQKKRDYVISHDDWAKMIKASDLLEIKVE